MVGHRASLRAGIILAGICLGLAGCGESQVNSHTSAAILADGGNGADWAGYGRTNGQQHFSPLVTINSRNVHTLGLAWSMDLPPVNTVTEPLAVGGVLYFATGLSVVRAVDAASGKLIWEYDPQVGEIAGLNMRSGWGVRGVAWWNGKIYVGTQDGRLIAVDAKEGRLVWSVQTYGRDDPAYISGAPRVFNGRVLIGFGGTVGKIRGYVTAYDAETGKQIWRFWTVPGDPARGFENPAMAMAAKTWSGEWWKFGGGATVWNSMAWDAESDTVYIGTGSPYPWNHHVRSRGKGDNLFVSSIVALDGKTGSYKWHYQVNPGDTWDFDATMDIQLADIAIRGKRHQVLMQAPKNGFFYVIDRHTGRLLTAEPYARTTWATHIDMRSGRPVEVPGARFPLGTSFLIAPSSIGAHNWMAMAFNPGNGLVYIPVQDFEANYSELPGDWKPSTDRTFGGAQMILGGPAAGTRKATGYLLAWSPSTQREVWRVQYPTFLNGGVLATAGDLVFQGSIDGLLRAFDARTGAQLWQYDTGAPVLSAPISFEAGGAQRVAVITGSGTANAAYSPSMIGPDLDRFLSDPRSQPRRLLVFAVGAQQTLSPRPVEAAILADADYRPDEAGELTGMISYLTHCSSCHGEMAISAGNGPDLRRTALLADEKAFEQVVRGGLLRTTGMPAFPEFPTGKLEAIRQYLRARAHAGRTGDDRKPAVRRAGTAGGI